MIINIVLVEVVKVIAFIGLIIVSGLFIMWPINDQPVSKGQWITWGIVVLIIGLLMYVPITFAVT